MSTPPGTPTPAWRTPTAVTLAHATPTRTYTLRKADKPTKLPPAPGTWAAQGSCVAEADLPWTADAAVVHPADAVLMAAICAACPVREFCANYAATTPHLGGTWATGTATATAKGDTASTRTKKVSARRQPRPTRRTTSTRPGGSRPGGSTRPKKHPRTTNTVPTHQLALFRLPPANP